MGQGSGNTPHSAVSSGIAVSPRSHSYLIHFHKQAFGGRPARVGQLLCLVLLCLTAFTAVPAHAAGKSDASEVCLGCHGDKSLSAKHGGATVSLFVDGKKFSGS